MRTPLSVFLCTLLLAAASLAQTAPAKPQHATNTKPTVADAAKFLADTETMLNDLTVKAARAQWVQETFITDDTEALSAEANERLIAAQTQLAEDVKRYDGLKLPPDMARKFLLLKLQLFSLPDAQERKEFTELASSLGGDYGKGKYCPKTGKHAGNCLYISDVEKILASSRDPEEMKDVWAGWHAVGAPMRQRYEKFMALQNKGARELGFRDMGAMWRSNYDMPPDQFSA